MIKTVLNPEKEKKILFLKIKNKSIIPLPKHSNKKRLGAFYFYSNIKINFSYLSLKQKKNNNQQQQAYEPIRVNNANKGKKLIFCGIFLLLNFVKTSLRIITLFFF